MRTALMVLSLVGLSALDAAGQSLGPAPATLSRADSAWTRGDRDAARRLYAEVLGADSSASRAVFRLAQLESSEERALALYRRYIALEPDDPWGHMAEGDLLARMGRLDDALVAYDGAHAIAPRERDVAIGRARLLDRAGRTQQATDELTAWTLAHPDDGEAWDLLGRVQLRAGRPRAAGASFLLAEDLGIHGAGHRLDVARAGAAPSITPEVTSLGDSDGNRTTRIGGSMDLMVFDGVRLGVDAAHHVVGGPVDEVSGNDLGLQAAAIPSSSIRVQAGLGLVRYGEMGESGPGRSGRRVPDWTSLQATARIRIRTPSAGPTLDLRLERAPLGFTPLLIENHVERSEARAVVELPLGALRMRGSGRVGHFTSAVDAPNGRRGFEGAVLLPVGGLQPSIQYRRAGFERASTDGYFAPRAAETIEAGVYAESGDEGRLTLAVDAGAGAQRVTPHGAATGPWSRVWRVWTQGTLALGPGRAWFTEVEAYDAPFALEGVGGAGRWRFLSWSSGLRWVVR